MAATTRARYIMVGGFLGAGKSTTLLAFAETLTARGLRVGLITNDQGRGLVDTALLRSRGFAVEEIAGGCFCCRFNSLRDAATKLTDDTRPDVFLAEPVGSCTDLMATVTYPLRRMYGDRFAIAPLSVVVDPVRAGRVLGVSEEGGSFSDKVLYVYRKQIEEAQILAINKVDLIEGDALAALREGLAALNPQAEIIAVGARDGIGLDAWLDRLMTSEVSPQAAMQVDYDRYADGEALLGWCNASVDLRSAQLFDGNAFLINVVDAIRGRLSAAGAEIAHLKATLAPTDGSGELGVVNVVRNDCVPEAGQQLLDDVDDGRLIINLRAEFDPAVLAEAVRAAVAAQAAATGVAAALDDIEHFRPGRPEPLYREEASVS